MDMQTYLNRVSVIFSRKGWTDFYSKNSLEKTITLGKTITDEEKDMIVDLLEKYLRIPAEKYISSISETLDSMDLTQYSTIKTYYVLQIKTERDRDKSKSGDLVAYYLAYVVGLNHKLFENKKVNLIAKNEIPNKINNSSIMKLFLVDDFIGTGNTVLEFLKELKGVVDKNKIVFLFLAGMQEAITRLKKDGYEVYCNVIQDKGISTIKEIPIRNKYIKLMTCLEDMFKFNENEKFGYGRSESLISLVRTPNNTFPIFWDKKNINAPFKR